MAECSACSASLPNGARYCPICGTAAESTSLPSQFEIGKLFALVTIKREILTWLGGSATIIGAALAILAYFGLNETVKSTVSEQIRKELERRNDEILKSTEAVFVTVGKAQKDQEQINSVLVESKRKLQEIDAQHQTVNAKLNELQTSLVVANNQKDSLNISITNTLTPKK
jgi:hypothetical protein